MLTYPEALAQMLAQASPFSARLFPLTEALGGVTAEPLSADRPLPPFDRVTMDGYAVRSPDLAAPGALRCIGSLPAGHEALQAVTAGTCLQVMTGAPLPPGADAVVPVEKVETEGAYVHFSKPVKAGENVVPLGSEAPAGQVFFGPGQKINASLMAFLASIGKTEVLAAQVPTLAVLSTGTELVAPGVTPKSYQIRDCNGPALLAQAAEIGIKAISLGIAKDEEADLAAKIRSGLAQAEVLLLSGGVSLGDFDLVPKVLADLGVQKIFHKVAIKPGKPLWFGVGDGKFVLALPGNPVAVQVGFKLFVEPLVLKLKGHLSPEPFWLRLPLKKLSPKTGDRQTLVPARLVNEGGTTWVEEIPFGGSGDFSGLAKSQGFYSLPANGTPLPAGTPVDYLPWRRLF